MTTPSNNVFNNEQLSKLFSRNFDGLDEVAIKEIIRIGKAVDLKTGDYLFREGDAADVLYILISGRLRAIKQEENDALLVLGDIGAGEPVGEFAFFTEDPRMASIIAIRDSVVLEFDQESYEYLVQHKPELASTIIRFIIKRLKRNAFERSKSSPPKNIAIISLQAESDLNDYTADIEREFGKMDVSTKIHCFGALKLEEQEALFENLEQHEGLNIMTCSIEHEEWSRKCIIYADLVIVATDFYADSKLYAIEKLLNLYADNILNKKTYLLFLHPNDGALPQNTGDWLKNRDVYLHLHLRKHNDVDTRRLCRIITHKAVGLVLGGGGAKGFAHIGVVKALYERGIEIDFLGGTSAGALYGLGMSFADFNFDKIHALNEEAVRRKLTSNDITLPLLSMMSGKKFKKYLKEMFKEHTIEDLWINSFAVSTNFSRAKMEVHKSGFLWKKVLASMAIPGIFPPVVIDKNLHVDGGVMDNLPIDPMYYYPVDTIIAVSLSNLLVVDVDYTESPTSWSLAWDKISRGRKYKIPGISSIIINSLILNSQQKQEITKDKVTHYLALDLKGIGMLDDKKWKLIQQKGYDQTKQFFETLNANK